MKREKAGLFNALNLASLQHGRPAVLEAPPDGNAFALIRVWADRIEIDGCGTAVPSRVLPLTPSRKRAARPEDGGGRRSSARVRAREQSSACSLVARPPGRWRLPPKGPLASRAARR